MKKGRISNALQRTFIFGSVAMLLTGLVFNGGDLSNADGTIASKVEKCALESVTMKVTSDANAEEEVYSGGLKSVLVDKNTSWNDYFGIREITAVSFVESDVCTAEETHEYVSAYVLLPEGAEYTYNDIESYAQETNNGVWLEIMNTSNMYDYVMDNTTFGCVNHIDVEYVSLDDSVGYYDVKIEPRFNLKTGESPTGIYVRFAKQYDITYDLAGGTVTDVEETYTAGTEYTLPIPTREDYYFTGWTGEGVTEPTREIVISADATGDRSYTANWVATADISTCTVALKNGDIYDYTGEEIKPEVTVKAGDDVLVEGTDYTVSYANNVNVAGKDADNAPTVTVTGNGRYLGNQTLTFTIQKATPSVVTVPTASAITEGQKLSDSILSGGKVVNTLNKAVEGTFTWKDGETVPAIADSGTTKYKVVFTPTDATGYETVETDVVVTVNAYSDEGGSTEGGSAAQPEVGDNMADKDNKATYKFTKYVDGNVEVAYVAPTSKTKTVSVPATVTLADGTTAKVTSIAAKAFKGNTKVQTVTIGKNVKTIGKEAFSGCNNLKKVKSAKNVTSIGKNAFANCKKLTSVAIGSKVTTIGEKAFYKCTKLTKITIPKNVKSVGKSAFQGCKKLTKITIKTTKLTKKNVGKNAFKGIPSDAKIDVPNSKVKAYKSILRAKGVSKKATIK